MSLYNFLELFAVFTWFLLILVIGYIVVTFVLYGIGLCQLAKTRGLANPWFAFVPVLQSYLAGELADDVNRRNGKSSSWKIVALILNILIIVLSVYSNVNRTGAFSRVLSWGIGVVTASYLYKVYEDHSPSRSIVYTVLTALFGLHPFFIFAIRNHPSVTISYQGGYRPGYGMPNPYGNPHQPQNPYQQNRQSYGYNQPPQGYGYGQQPSQYGSGYPQTPPPYGADYSRPYSNPYPQYGVQPFADTPLAPGKPFAAGSYNNGGHGSSRLDHMSVPEFKLPGQSETGRSETVDPTLQENQN